MSRKLSPYERKEWHRKHSRSRELKTFFKWTDAAARGAVEVGKVFSQVEETPGLEKSQHEWKRVGLSKIQLAVSLFVGAFLPMVVLPDKSAEKLSLTFWDMIFFFFALPFLLSCLVFIIFNTLTRPKIVNTEKAEIIPKEAPPQVPNPTGDPYLKRWNERSSPEIIEVEMPELSFQTSYDFSKVRVFDFGMENNQTSFFIDGHNRETATDDILQLNRYLAQGNEENPNIPLFQIGSDIRYEPSRLGMDDYTRLYMLPLTPTGKKPKYPLTMKFVLLSQDEHWSRSTTGGTEIFGQIWYLQNGEIGKAKIVCWKYAKQDYGCYVFQIRKSKDGLFLQKVETPVQPN